MTKNTRQLLMEAGERLFAERGFSSVSVREILAAAHQRHISAVQYYFGSKEGLIKAILQYRMRPINDRRLAMLGMIERQGRTDDLRSLVEAMVYPLAESLQHGSRYLRFVAHLSSDPVYDQILTDDPPLLDSTREGAERVVALEHAALRWLPASLRTQRVQMAHWMLVRAFALYERELEAGSQPVVPTAVLAANLVDMIVGMMAARLSPGTRRLMRSATRGSPNGRKTLARRTGSSRALPRL